MAQHLITSYGIPYIKLKVAKPNAVHNAVREMYPGKEVLAVFQPHLFSRTRDLADDFAEVLSKHLH